MKLLAALTDGNAEVDATLAGIPVGWLRVATTWDTGIKRLDEHLLYLVESGEISVSYSGTSEMARAGSVVVIPAGLSFQARCGAAAPSFWRLRLRLPSRWRGPLVTPGCQDLEPVIARLVTEASAAPSPYRTASIRGGVLVLIAALARRQTEHGGADQLSGLSMAQRTAVERHADLDPTATPRDLMRRLELSLDYGTRLFTASYGRPPRRWLLERRMHAAAVRVVEGEESITAIADDLGYADVRLFARQFRMVLGQPPGRFRAAVRAPS